MASQSVAVSVLVFFLVVCNEHFVESAQLCYRPEIPAFSKITPDSLVYSKNSTVAYTCKSGYVLDGGDPVRTCGGRTWSGTPPLCKSRLEICSGEILNNDKCLTLRRTVVSWEDAAKQCGDNSTLVTLIDDSVVRNATNLLVNNYMDRAWIGGHSEYEYAWLWADNSEIKQFSWAADQPLNPTKNTDHIQLRKADGYKWRTSSGSNVYEDPDGWSVNKYICQYVGNCAQTTNPHIFLNGSCFVYTTKDYHQDHDGKCTSWNEERPGHYNNNYWTTYCRERGISWNDANTACETLGGILAQPDSQYLISSLTEYIIRKAGQERRFAGNYWIGGSYGYQMKWRWGDNDAVSTLPVPTNSSVSEECGYLTRNGAIETVKCGDNRNWLLSSFLCEREISKSKVQCGTPPQAPNTRVVSFSHPVYPGETIRQECADGYSSSTGIRCYCYPSGRWDPLCASSIQCRANPTTTPASPSTPSNSISPDTVTSLTTTLANLLSSTLFSPPNTPATTQTTSAVPASTVISTTASSSETNSTTSEGTTENSPTTAILTSSMASSTQVPSGSVPSSSHVGTRTTLSANQGSSMSNTVTPSVNSTMAAAGNSTI